jgi:uncharacterized protein (DUF427 family)
MKRENEDHQSKRESVWDYPRPPQVEPTSKVIKVVAGGMTIAETTRAYRVLETSHPPVYYIPPEDVRTDLLETGTGRTLCEFKGFARYYTLVLGDRRIENAAWSYPDPWAGYMMLKDHIAFYPRLMDQCLVDGEPVTPEPGEYYGGWITRDIVGHFRKTR